MIALIQRVNWARVNVEVTVCAEIEKGILAFIGIEKADTAKKADELLDKILAYRVFADAEGRMNLNLQQANGGLLLVSQFTLAANTNSGLRPSFSTAMEPAAARAMYEQLVESARMKHSLVASGQFGADMQVELENDGPVTFILSN